jgi:S1-C subfamily serine protease
MGTSSDLMIGEKVVVIGNPFRQRLTASTGIISGLHRNMAVGDLMFPDLIQTDASINPGNSGGPMLNILGEMIGMTTLVRQEAEKMAFAIPIDRIKDVLSEELLAPTAARAYLGVEIPPGGPAVVSRIVAQGPGDLAGLRADDRIEALNGEPIADASDFNLKHLPLRWVKPIQLRVARGEEHLELSVLPWNKIDGILYERLGMTVESVALGRYPFLMVKRVAPDGPAQKLGLKRDDIIESLRAEGGQAWVVSSDRGLARLISTMKPGTELALDVLRDDNGDQQLDHSKELYKARSRCADEPGKPFPARRPGFSSLGGAGRLLSPECAAAGRKSPGGARSGRRQERRWRAAGLLRRQTCPLRHPRGPTA